MEKVIPKELDVFVNSSDEKLTLDYTELSKIPKMLRFHWNHFKKENNVSVFEELVSYMKLKKRQYKIFTNNVQPAITVIKGLYQE